MITKQRVLNIINEHTKMYILQKRNSDETQNDYLEGKLSALKALKKHIELIDFNQGLL